MAVIVEVNAREILDSRGNPTVEVDVILEDGSWGRAAVPSGASTGRWEAHELRDGADRYRGKGVETAVSNVIDRLAPTVIGFDSLDQDLIDQAMIELDGTANKGELGSNAILGVSLAVAKAQASSLDIPLYRYIGGLGPFTLPVPLMNIINGGQHADNGLDVQEFMIVPAGASTFREALRYGAEVFHSLRELLRRAGHVTAVGDEGGYAPALRENEEALSLLMEAIDRAGLRPGRDVWLALDVAASGLYEGQRYHLRGQNMTLSREELVDLYARWCSSYPVISIEDGMAEDDEAGWKMLTALLGQKVQLVGDDVFVTSTERLEAGARAEIANAILIKVNQVGTLSETLAAIATARELGYAAVISHRSGETEDVTIADLAAGASCGQIKAGAPCRSERVAKYNQLLRIEEELAGCARFAGLSAFMLE